MNEQVKPVVWTNIKLYQGEVVPETLSLGGHEDVK